ncbi:MAG: hypothetical protein K0U84_13435 [Actinomycetia bacterium]|nr:hypothetical protein [Actinomycetes bacterium]
MATPNYWYMDTLWSEMLQAVEDEDPTGISLIQLSLMAYRCGIVDAGLILPAWIESATQAIYATREEMR